MLVELRVTNLGVIEDQAILLGPGLTALTGETGAGKTLIVDAISLLAGAPSDPSLVTPGASEARIEGRFEGFFDDHPEGAEARGPDGSRSADRPGEIILTRVIPASGRSRGYVDGHMASLAQLAELGRHLVDIHGQHAHQSLFSPVAQRNALDTAAGIDTAGVESWRRRVRELSQALAELGGDPRERARQLDLLSYQLGEIDAARVDDPDEDRRLLEEEELLADAAGLVQAAGAAWEALAGDDGLVERLGSVVSATSGRRTLSELHDRLLAAQEELVDVAAEARRVAESVEDDPGRLAAIGERRRTLTELRRKYGGTLEEVIGYREDLRRRVGELESHDRRAAEVGAELERSRKELTAALERVWEARRAAAPRLAAAVEKHLRTLAMPRARFEVEVGPEPAEESVTWMLGANPGQPLLPLAKVASGGELSRAMLATRLVMGPGAGRPGPGGHGPPGEEAGGRGNRGPTTLIFDEIDAGVGGEAAVAVGRALAALGEHHQVLVVTHLAQVAAFASAQLSVAKEVVSAEGKERTVAEARPVEGEARVVELARMLSGRPDSESARRHAEELLSAAGTTPLERAETADAETADADAETADRKPAAPAPSTNSGRRRR